MTSVLGLALGGLGYGADRVYRTSIDPGAHTFSVYDTTAGTWTNLGSVATGSNFAVSQNGELFMLNDATNMIQKYAPTSNTWSDVTAGPPSGGSNYGNLEVTNAGKFLFTKYNSNQLWHNTSGSWVAVTLPGTASALGDYDPATNTYAVSAYNSEVVWKVDVSSFAVTVFSNGAVTGVGELRRFGEIYNGEWYTQSGGNVIRKVNLVNSGNPYASTPGITSPGNYTSAAVNEATGVFYINPYGSSEFKSWNSATGVFTALSAAPTADTYNTLAFVRGLSVELDGITNLGYTTATLKARINPSGDATTAVLQYGLTNAYGTNVAVPLSPNNGTSFQSVSVPLTGLPNGTTYHYRFSATNASGTVNTADATFTTYLDSPPVFTSTPLPWAVVGGTYEFIPQASNTGTPPVTYTVLQKPAWLTFDSTRLSGTPPPADEGLNPLVLVRATNGDGRQTDLSFRVRVGRLVGPAATPPGGGSKTWVTGMPQLARNGGDSLLVTGVSRSDEFPIFWGLLPNGMGMKMNYVGPSGSGGTDFSVPEGFTFDPAEILKTTSESPADLSAGIAVWKGTTNRPASNGGAAVNTYLRANPRDLADTVSLSLTSGEVLGVASSVGAMARIPDSGDLRVGLRLHAVGAYPAGSPALDWFNALSPKLATDRTITSFSSGFYWVNTPPTLTVNTGAVVNQGATVGLTTARLNALDKEDPAADVRFVLGDGSSAGTPINGTLQLFDGSAWNPIPAQGSFTLAQLAAGSVRYVNGGSYETSDSFQFRVFDAQNTVARDGNYTVFSFPISVTRVNHPPVATNQSFNVGLGATITGTLNFSDPDIGYLAQSIAVTTSATTTLGTFTITNPATGDFSFVSNGTGGSEVIAWQVSDGSLTATANLTLVIQNQTPVVQPLQLTGAGHQGLTGTVVVVDPDLPAQTQTLAVVGPPAKGTVSISGLDLSYTANPGRFGQDQFTIRATDSVGAVSLVQTVTVLIRPSALGPQALFVGGHRSLTGGGQEGVIQRFNPDNGDVYTLATNLGREVRGLAWSESRGRLIAAVSIQDSGSPMNGLIKVDPLTGLWAFGDVVTVDGNLAFPLNVANDGPDHVLVANGPAGVLRVSIVDGSQQVMNLGLPAGEFVVSAIPIGLDDIWVSSIRNLSTAGDGSLFRTNRNTNSAATPVSFSPSGDPAALLVAGGQLAVSRAGVPVETITLSPLSYSAHAGSPVAAWSLPVGMASYGNSWLVSDPFAGALFRQIHGSTVVSPVSATGLASPFGLLSVTGSSAFSVSVAGSGTVASGATVNLGMAVVGSAGVSRNVSVTNTGTNLVTFGAPVVTGANAGDFTVTPPPGDVVGPGETVTFVVHFAPGAAGARSASLSLPNDVAAQNPFTLSLTGTGNTAPIFSGYSASTPYQTAASLSKSKLLSAASDADGHALSVTAAGPSSEQGGTAVLQSGSILYTPPLGFSGVDTFSVSITDAQGATVNGTVTVTVGTNPGSGGQGTNTPQLTVNPGGHVGISFQGIPGRSYQIQRSTNMSDWTPIITVTAASNGAVTFTDEDPPPGSAFYRLRKP